MEEDENIELQGVDTAKRGLLNACLFKMNLNALSLYYVDKIFLENNWKHC